MVLDGSAREVGNAALSLETRHVGSPAVARLVAQLLGLIAAILVLTYLRTTFVFDFDEAAMGRMTVGLLGSAATGGKVHCAGATMDECIEAYDRAGRPPAWLWLGNSQLHGINRYVEGQKTAPMGLHDLLAPQDVYLVTSSLPNATTAEFLTIFYSIGDRIDIKKVILPIVFNGLRGGAVREREWPVLRDPAVIARLETSRAADYMRRIVKQATPARAGEKEVDSRSVEDRLNGLIGEIWPLWAARAKLRALVNYAYHVGRHKALGVTAQTKRTLVGPGFDAQMMLLGSFLDDLRAKGISVLVYVPPYRNDIPGPYIEAEYDSFKRQLAALASEKGHDFVDLDDIVPGPEWGMVRDYVFGITDYDFMHFTSEGHRRLAEALYAHLMQGNPVHSANQ